MIDPSQITAAAPTPPAADQITPTAESPLPSAPTSTDGGGIPDEVLQIPAVQGLLEGKPAAVYAVKGKQSPVIDAIPKHIDELIKAGIGIYKSQDGLISIMFNSRFISAEEVKKADKENKLTQIAEPVDAVIKAYDSVLGSGSAPAPDGTTPAAVTAPAPTPVASTPAPIQRKLTTARLQNLSPGSPTSGPLPGAGRVANEVMKRAI